MKDEFKADALIFDIDGVLLDVTKSFPEVIRLAVVQAGKNSAAESPTAPATARSTSG